MTKRLTPDEMKNIIFLCRDKGAHPVVAEKYGLTMEELSEILRILSVGYSIGVLERAVDRAFGTSGQG